jgi:hypothetical protein
VWTSTRGYQVTFEIEREGKGLKERWRVQKKWKEVNKNTKFCWVPVKKFRQGRAGRKAAYIHSDTVVSSVAMWP